MSSINLLGMATQYNTVSIIGMDKNVGKTTVLNYILSKARGKYSLGLTSIGRDGEDQDTVTATEKPRIYIEKGTYVATSKQCLFNSDITREIIKTTGISTAMGEVVIIKALSDGYVELGGPSLNTYIAGICKELKNLGSDLVIVDGALSRKTFASPSITEATILSTGAALSRSMDKVVDSTSYAVKLLSLEKESSSEIVSLCNSNGEDSRISIINKNSEIHCLEVKTSLEASKDILENLKDDTEYVYIKGIVSDKLLQDIMKATDKYKHITFLAEDGTKIFIGPDTLFKLQRQGGKLKVLNPINIISVTANPKSPFGYEFDRDRFLEKLRSKIDLPVIDVKVGD